MINRMIDEQTLNDLQYAGFPELIVTDEVMIDVEKRNSWKLEWRLFILLLAIICALGTVFSITNMAKSKSMLAAVIWSVISTSYLLATIGTLVKFIITALGV